MQMQIPDKGRQGVADGRRVLQEASDRAERREGSPLPDEKAEVRTVRACDTRREHPAQGCIGNDVVLVVKEFRIETGLTDHLAGICPELAQEGTDLPWQRRCGSHLSAPPSGRPVRRQIRGQARRSA